MISVRIEEKPAFRVIGKKTWISGTDDSLFGQFWNECREEGLFKYFDRLRDNKPGLVTNSMMVGVSCVEKDPNNRSFNFYIALESNKSFEGLELEEYFVPAAKWAIFQNSGQMPKALIDAEMYAFKEWLPNSNYEHAYAPEMEVYPPCDNSNGDTLVEFWLPIE